MTGLKLKGRNSSNNNNNNNSNNNSNSNKHKSRNKNKSKSFAKLKKRGGGSSSGISGINSGIGTGGITRLDKSKSQCLTAGGPCDVFDSPSWEQDYDRLAIGSFGGFALGSIFNSTPVHNNIDIGVKLDVLDKSFYWYGAAVIDMRLDGIHGAKSALVSYDNFGNDWDEWISLNNETYRLAKCGTRTKIIDKNTHKNVKTMYGIHAIAATRYCQRSKEGLLLRNELLYNKNNDQMKTAIENSILKYDIIHCGYIYKRGNKWNTDYKQRWFVLKNDWCLYYFEHKLSNINGYKGYIYLQDIIKVVKNIDIKHCKSNNKRTKSLNIGKNRNKNKNNKNKNNKNKNNNKNKLKNDKKTSKNSSKNDEKNFNINHKNNSNNKLGNSNNTKNNNKRKRLSALGPSKNKIEIDDDLCFQIECDKKTYFLSCKTNDDLIDWISVLQAMMYQMNIMSPMPERSNIIKNNKLLVPESDHDHVSGSGSGSDNDPDHSLHEHEPDHEHDDIAYYSDTTPNGYDNSLQQASPSPIISPFSRPYMTLKSPNSNNNNNNNYLNSPSSQERKSKRKSMGNLLFKRKTHNNNNNNSSNHSNSNGANSSKDTPISDEGENINSFAIGGHGSDGGASPSGEGISLNDNVSSSDGNYNKSGHHVSKGKQFSSRIANFTKGGKK